MAVGQFQSRTFLFVEPGDFLLEQDSHEEQSQANGANRHRHCPAQRDFGTAKRNYAPDS